MKLKTFVGTNIEELDEEFNKFEEENVVKATQTRTVVVEGKVVHYYTAFIIPDKKEVVDVAVKKVK